MVIQSILNKVWNIHNSDQSIFEKVRSLHALLEILMEEVLKEEDIHFTTLFTKVSYLCLKFKFSKRLVFFSHLHRKRISQLTKNNAEEIDYDVIKYVIIGLIKTIYKVDLDRNIYSIFIPPEIKVISKRQSKRKIDFARVHAFEFKKEHALLVAIDEVYPEEIIHVKLNVLGENDDYNSLIPFLERSKHIPVTLHLKQISIDEDGNYTPGRIILEPDYLVDITTISECFKPNESNPFFYFIKKFIPVSQNKYLIIGNVANYFLDEIFNNVDTPLKELMSKVFNLSPLGFSLMDDNTLKEVVSKLKIHYSNIRKVVKEQFPIQAITNDNSFLEPSFYSPMYGIQGRLDLFSQRNEEGDAKIVELKSGRPYMANSYGLNINHYVQTLLYDLMVSEVFENKLKISNFILYSSQSQNPFKFAPPLAIQQKEALKLRNELVEIDYLLSSVQIDNDDIFKFVSRDIISSDGFAARDLDHFQKIYSSSTELSKKYFNAYTAFVAKEQILAKTGEFGIDKSNGLAGLWLDDIDEKISNFRVLNHLKITSIQNEGDNTIINFEKSDETSQYANFRVGDLGVLYPFNNGNKSAIRNQIFKCSIIDMNALEITARLRNKQNNLSLFSVDQIWNIEHDHLDHGFNVMYQDLFKFLGTERRFQEIMLGRIAPEKTNIKVNDLPSYQGLTEEQRNVLKEMFSSKDYFLLWGPPGTGKTSAILKHYLEYLYEETNEVTLVLAYTNRAVDEICEAVENISTNIKETYLRIGSRYSTNEKFRDNLLVSKLERVNNRSELINMLSGTRIVVSTLASIHGKKEIFSMMKFNSIIVDEASQILEPQIIGLLSMAPKFVLIGDHNQLPAIVLQKENESLVEEKQLNSIGIIDRRNSLFERLYKRCLERSWIWAIGNLSQQGRMHIDIMNFVNEHFYNHQLQTINGIKRLSADNYYPEYKRNLDEISNNRLIYIPSMVDVQSTTFKSNIHEARISAQICKRILSVLKEVENQESSENKIGIITPYRAQISAIRSELEHLNIGPNILVDTVERYQGGAKDIIIISMCLNLESQLNQLVNYSTDGIDRKLNVALTRAREQLIIIGNEGIMKNNITYASLIEASYKMSVN